MKIKNIMLITFLLLAVLTIGAASASDDVALDNVTVSDDANEVIASEEDYDPYEDYLITIDEDPICIDPENEEDYDEEYAVASLDVDTTSPEDIKGSFQLWKEKEKLVEIKIDPNDEHWEYDEDIGLSIYILLKDIDLTKINDRDLLSFKYFDEGQTSPVDDLTVYGRVSINNEYLTLTDIDDEYEDVEVTYSIDDPVVMEEGWEETEFAEFKVIDGLDGRIVIYLNETLAFNKTLSDVENEDGDYIILLSDLKINQSGKYII